MNLDKFKNINNVICIKTHKKCLYWNNGEVEYFVGKKYKCVVNKHSAYINTIIHSYDVLLVKTSDGNSSGGPMDKEDIIKYFLEHFITIDEHRKSIIEKLI